MSSLWTPGGEVPVDRTQPSADSAPPPSDSGAQPPPDRMTEDDEAIREHVEALQAQMLSMPAADVVAEHAMGLYQLAVLHITQPQPKLAEARLAIDGLAALVEGLAGRLGDAEQALGGALHQLRMAFVEATDRATPGD